MGFLVMNTAHDAAPLNQKHSSSSDVAHVLQATFEKIATGNFWIHTHLVWPEMTDRQFRSPAQSCFEAGMALYECGEFEKAVAEFQAALHLDWRHEDALKWIPIAERAAGERAAAAAYPSALGLSGLNRLASLPLATVALGTE